MNVTSAGWPEPVANLVHRMAGFFPLCKRVVEELEGLEKVRGYMPRHLQMPDYSWPVLPETLTDRGEFYKWQTDNRRNYRPTLGVWTQLLLAEDLVRFEIRLWRAALDDVRYMLPSVIDWMDDPTKPAYLRWTGEVSEQLAVMGGLINRYTAEDPPDSLDVEAFQRCYISLWQSFRELKRVVGGPVVVPGAFPQANTAPIAPLVEQPPVSPAATSPKAETTEAAGKVVSPPAPSPPQYRPPAPTQKELRLASGVKETKTPEISGTLFLTLVSAAGVRKARRGEKSRRYEPHEVRALISAAQRLGTQSRDVLAERWGRFADSIEKVEQGTSEDHGKIA